MRPAHIHFRVKKLGFDPLITHVFVDGDEFLDSDAVFGVRGSCIGNYALNPPGATPFGDISATPYYTLDYCFSLHPLTSTGPSTMWCLEIYQRPHRYDPRRVDGFVAFIIVPLNVFEIDRLAHTGPLEEFARIGPQMRIF